MLLQRRRASSYAQRACRLPTAVKLCVTRSTKSHCISNSVRPTTETSANRTSRTVGSVYANNLNDTGTFGATYQVSRDQDEVSNARPLVDPLRRTEQRQ
jgi:hypothetical protein